MDYQIHLGNLSLGTPLLWRGNPNFHAYITGASGQGKTFRLREMAKQIPEQGGRCIIADFSGDFVRAYPQQSWPVVDTEVIDLRSGNYQLNPFLPLNENETIDDITDRVMDMFSSGLRLGPSQWALLSDIIDEGLHSGELTGMDYIIEYLQIIGRGSALTLLPKMKTLKRLLPCGKEEIDWKADTPGITIVDLSKVKDPTARIILSEMIMSAICSIRMNGEPGDYTPLVLLFDECQHLRFREYDHAVKILREGRKYGIWGWFSTQWIHNRTAAAALGQAGLRIYFCPAEDDLHDTALKLSCGNRKMVEGYENRLRHLKVGQFMFWNGNRLITSSPPA